MRTLDACESLECNVNAQFVKHRITGADLRTRLEYNFDSSLNFEAHVRKHHKANSMMGIIRCTFEYLDDKCFSTVFKSCPTTYRVCKPGMESIFNETHNST